MTKRSAALNHSLSEYGIRTRKKVRLKEKEHCFKVVNTEDFSELNEHKPITLTSGKRVTENREEFEERIKREYGTDNAVWID